MDEVMETTGLRLQQLKEAARETGWVGRRWKNVVKSSPGGVCFLMEQGDAI